MAAPKGKKTKQISSKRVSKESLDSLPLDNVLDQSVEVFSSALESAFETRRDFFVHEMVQKLGAAQLSEQDAVRAGSAPQEWIGIESLSRLRNMVGGRFQNLKKKWMGAGFPLREHRGDKGTNYKVDETGWIELSNWILKQGFESRLPSDSSDCLFELRALQD